MASFAFTSYPIFMRPSVLFIGLLSIFLIPGIYAQDSALLEEAHIAYSSQDYKEAFNKYNAYLEQDSSQLIVIERCASSAMKLGDLIKARDLFLEVEKKDTAHILGLRSLASIYESEKNTPKAIKYYTRLSQLLPEDGVVFRKLGQMYKSAGLKRLAYDFYFKAVELNPRDLYAIDGLAELYILDKRYPAADSILWQGLAMDSLHIDMNLLISGSKFRQKAYDSTAYHMWRIRGKYDFRPHQSRMLGYAFMQLDSLDLAIRYLSAAILDEGSKEHAHYNLGIAYEKKGNIEYAEHHFKEALKAGISGNVDLYHRNLARLYNRDENLKDAIPHYKDAYKYSQDPIILFYLGRASDVYYADKNIALRYYKKFVNSGYDHEEYREYAKARSIQLVEQIHQQK